MFSTRETEKRRIVATRSDFPSSRDEENRVEAAWAVLPKLRYSPLLVNKAEVIHAITFTLKLVRTRYKHGSNCRVILPGQNTFADTLYEPDIRRLSARFMALSQDVLPALEVITLALAIVDSWSEGLREPTTLHLQVSRISSIFWPSVFVAIFQMALAKVRRASLIPRSLGRLRDIRLLLSVNGRISECDVV